MTLAPTSATEQFSMASANTIRSQEQNALCTGTVTEAVNSGFQPYKAPSLNDASKIIPPSAPSPFPSPYGYPPSLFGGHQMHSYR